MMQIHKPKYLISVFSLKQCPIPCPAATVRRAFHTTRIEATQLPQPGSSNNSSTIKTDKERHNNDDPASWPRKLIVSTYLCIGDPLTTTPSSSFRVCVLRRRRRGHVYAGKWSVVAGSIKSKSKRGKEDRDQNEEDEADASPLAAALREVREETTLTLTATTTITTAATAASPPQKQLRVLVQGAPFNSADAALRVVWRIHPFLMRIVTGGPDVSDDGDNGSVIDSDKRNVFDDKRKNEQEQQQQEEEEAKARSFITLDEEHDEMRFVRPEELSALDTVAGLANTLGRLLEEYRQQRGVTEK